MIEKMLFGRTIAPLAKKCLDAYALRHKVIASNIANADAEGYNRREVKFEDELRRCLRNDLKPLLTTHEKHIPGGSSRINELRPGIVTDYSKSDPNTVNNVDIDLELAELTKNQIDFNVMSTILQMQYARLRMAIRGV